MRFDKTGIILYTIRYEECVDFYGNILELKRMFSKDTLTCFEFGGAYLMVEIADDYKTEEVHSDRIKTCLRMNVPDVKRLADKLIAEGIAVDYQEHSWGTVAKFLDPDGNLCALRDSRTFGQG